jgi:hypothetical protein
VDDRDKPGHDGRVGFIASKRSAAAGSAPTIRRSTPPWKSPMIEA